MTFAFHCLADLLAAVQFVSLESACMEYLSGRAQQFDASELLCLAQLADHLGLSPLLDTAAEHLIALPWHENVSPLCAANVSLHNKHTEAQNTFASPTTWSLYRAAGPGCA